MVIESTRPMSYSIARLKDKMKQLDITVDDNGTQEIKVVTELWRAALKSLRTVRKDHIANRENHLLDLLNKYDKDPNKEGNKEKAKQVLSAILSNKMRQPY